MPFARKNDPLTSHEAAESVVAVSETQKVILDLLSGKPMCDQELNERYQMRWASGLAPAASESGVRSRRHELAVEGLVVDCGVASTVFGRKALVWKVA